MRDPLLSRLWGKKNNPATSKIPGSTCGIWGRMRWKRDHTGNHWITDLLVRGFYFPVSLPDVDLEKLFDGDPTSCVDPSTLPSRTGDFLYYQTTFRIGKCGGGNKTHSLHFNVTFESKVDCRKRKVCTHGGIWNLKFLVSCRRQGSFNSIVNSISHDQPQSALHVFCPTKKKTWACLIQTNHTGGISWRKDGFEFSGDDCNPDLLFRRFLILKFLPVFFAEFIHTGIRLWGGVESLQSVDLHAGLQLWIPVPLSPGQVRDHICSQWHVTQHLERHCGVRNRYIGAMAVNVEWP